MALNRHGRRRLKWRKRNEGGGGGAPKTPKLAGGAPVLFESYEPRLLLSGAPVGTVLASSSGPAIYQDDDGTTVTATLSGAGSWQLVQGAVHAELTVTGTDAASSFSIKTSGGDGRLDLQRLTVQGALGSLDAATTDAVTAITLGGAVQKIVLGNVRDTVLTASAEIGSLAVESWQGTGAANRIVAPSIGSLTSQGNLNLDLDISGVGQALGSVLAKGALTGGTWQVAGDVGSVTARAVGAAWTGDFAGETGVVQTTGAFQGTLATPVLQVLAVGTGLLGAHIEVGATLGADGRPGGTGADADSFGAGYLGQLRVGGSMIAARVHVGVDPSNGIYDDGDDVIIGGAASRIQSITIGGRVDSASRIVAGALPPQFRVGGKAVTPGAASDRYATAPLDVVRPDVTLALSNDTGPSATDGITADPAIAGVATDAGEVLGLLAMPGQGGVPAAGIARMSIGLDATPAASFLDATYLLDAQGRFALSRDDLDALAGGTLAFGAHVLHVVAVDYSGNVRTTSIAFTLSDTQIAAGLANDTGVSNSDGTTKDYAVAGKVAAGVGLTAFTAAIDGGAAKAVTVLGDGSFTLSKAQIDTLAGKALAEGQHSLVLTATDTTGVKTSKTLAFTYDVTPPTLGGLALTAASDTGVVGDNETAAYRVGILGQAEAGATATLGGAKALAAGNGAFQFADVVLADGANKLSVTVTDLAGNTVTQDITITRAGTVSADAALTWNQATLEAVRKASVYPEVATRLMAMVSIAQFDTLAAIEGSEAYLVKMTAPGPADTGLALAYAAHRVLSDLFPAQKANFDAILATAVAAVPDGAEKTNAQALGQAVGQAVLDIRATDGSGDYVEYLASSDVGRWRPTEPSYEVAEQPQWAQMTPFAMESADQFQAPPPPDLTSAEYAAAVNETKELGSATSATRTADETQQAQFWADGRGSYTPPGHWNQIAQQVALAQGNSLAANVRLFAQLNVALADTAIASWNTKFAYNLWRPVDAIHNADQDGNTATAQDLDWAPLLITPPHPEYVSGHSSFSSAAATVLQAVFGDVAFSATSYTLPGVTRNFTSFQQAVDEAGRSRIYGGIHYEFSNQGGQVLGAQVAGAVLARFNLATDTQGPNVVVSTVPVAAGANPVFNGQVLDNLSGVAAATVSIDGGPAQALMLDAEGRFTLPTTFVLDGTQDGMHTLSFGATDVAGNAAKAVTRTFRLDTVAPVLSLTGLDDGTVVGAGSRIAGVADPTGATLRGLTYAFDGGKPVSVSFNATTGVFNAALNTAALDIGTHTLVVTATDLAGNATTTTRTVTVESLIAFTVTALSPTDGQSEVGSTVRPEVRFSRAVKLDTLNENTFYATDSSGAKLAATIVPAQDGTYAWLFFDAPMPGGATITLHLNGNAIRAAADGAFLDANLDGTPGGERTYSFTTVSLTPVAGTVLKGRVVDPGPDLLPMTFDDMGRGPDGVIHTPDDVFKSPIAHAKIFVLGMEDQFVYTDAQGFFTLENLPAGTLKVAIDGRTATNAPAGVFWPEMVMDVELRPGVQNTFMDSMGTEAERAANAGRVEVYLPRVPVTMLSPVSDSAPTTVGVDADGAPNLTAAQRAALTLTVDPGSVIGADGQPVTDAQVGISTVPPELVRDMLPPGVLQHTFDITIQAPGVSTFATPARITFPNVFNAAPGTKLNVLSFDHTTGMLVINGTATVSEDGLTVVSDEGSGVRAPGWHGITPPGGCNPAGGAPPPPPPPDPTETVTEHPAVALNLMSGSAATDNFPGFTWTAPPKNPNVPDLPPIPGCDVPPHQNSDPQQPFINVTIEIDGPLATFAKPVGGSVPLQSQAFTLSPGTGVTKKFDFDAKTYVEMFGSIQGFADLLRDQLYGAKIKITVVEQHSNGDRSRDIYTFYQDRWVDVVDAYPASKMTGETMAFMRTNTDGVVRTNNVDLFLPTSVTTTFESVGASPFSLDGKFSGTGTLVGKFDPDKAGYDQTAPFKITVSDSKGPLAVGTISAIGSAVAPTTISVNEAGYRAELDRALKATYLVTLAGKDGKVGTADDTTSYFYDYGGGVKQLALAGKDGKLGTADDVTVNVVANANQLGTVGASFLVEFKDFLPGKAYTAKQYSDMLDAQTAAMKAAVVADYALVGKQYKVVAANAGADVTMQWGDTFWTDGSLVYGFADFDRAGKFQAYYYNLRDAAGKGSISQAALEYAIAQGLNVNPVNSGQFGVAINFDWESGASFAQFVANTVSHELGHTFGLEDAYVNIKGKGSPPVDPPNDIMRSGNTKDPDLTFAATNVDTLKAALGLQANGDTPITAAVLLYRNNFNLPASAKGLREGINTLTTPFLDVSWAGGSLYGGAPVTFGAVAADASFGEMSLVNLTLTNSGFSALNLDDIALAKGDAGFKIASVGLKGSTLAAGASTVLTLAFDPAVAGTATDTLTIVSNSEFGPVSVALRGSGIALGPVATTKAGNNNFGGLQVGAAPSVRDNLFSISNSGSDPLTITGVELVEGAAEYALLGVPANLAGSPVSLATGETFSFGVQFSPTALGLQRGVIRVSTNDPANSVIYLGVTGTGVTSLPTAAWGNDFVGIQVMDPFNPPPLHAVSDPGGNFSFFLASDRDYTMSVFDPSTGLVATDYGHTAPSGKGVDLTASLVFMASVAPDSDYDGLPDDIEFAIGSNARSADTDRDGLNDFAEIRQGLDALGGLGLPTGVVAAAALKGSAEAVTVTGSTTDPTRLTAFVATGTAGLAVVDVSKFSQPAVLAELDLGGENTRVVVDDQRGVALVAGGTAGLHFVDITNPAAPTLLRTETLGDSVTAVALRDGSAFVGAGTKIHVLDVATGDLRQTLDLGGATIVDVVTDNDGVYALDANHRLSALHVFFDQLELMGSLTLADGGERLTVASGIAYVSSRAAGGGGTGGISTVDVSNPVTPSLISGVDDTSLAGTAVALNGSGLAVAVGGINFVFGGFKGLDLLDVSDAKNTGGFISRTPLPDFGRDVTIANGVAFVADGAGGLQIVNYRAFDTKGTAPVVSGNFGGGDEDPGTPGLQVLAGRSVHIMPTVTDDVQVRNVEVLVNGKVVANDASYPFDLFVPATAADASGTMTMQIRATDTGGNVGLSDLMTVQVVPDTFPPDVAAVNIAEGAKKFFVRNIEVRFDEPVDPALLNSGNVTLVNLGADGTAGTADDVQVALKLGTRGGNEVVSAAPVTPLVAGNYQFRIDPSAIADTSGNVLTTAVVRNFTIRPASDVKAAQGTAEFTQAPSANPGQQIGISVPFDPSTAHMVFATMDSNGTKGSADLAAARYDAAQGIAYFNVPYAAVTGDVTVYSLDGATKTGYPDGDFLLQVVPVVTDVQFNYISGTTMLLTLSGFGFVEGNATEYRVGSETVVDAAANTGPDVYAGAPSYNQNTAVQVQVNLTDGAFGPVSVKTAGGTSTAFSINVAGILGKAMSGTPADAAIASANPGQSVTIVGTGLTMGTDVLMRYRESGSGATVQWVSLSPASVSADGTKATIVVPRQANEVFGVHVVGASGAPLLQVVPTVTGVNQGTSGQLYVAGSGFVEGGTTIDFKNGQVKDTAANAGADIYYDNGADNSGINLAEPVHGLGGITVTTAGGTSAPLGVNEMVASVGYLRNVAVDPANGDLWVVDNANPASLHRIDRTTGLPLQTIALNAADIGNTTFFGMMQVVPTDFTLGATSVPAGSLLLVNGWANADRAVAVNLATGATIAVLALGKNYDTTQGVYDPATGNIFLLDRSVGPNRIAIVNPLTGAETGFFAAPVDAGEGGMALDPSGNSIWYASYNSRVIYELSKTGEVLRSFSAALQGADDAEITGISFDTDGKMLASTVNGRIYVLDSDKLAAQRVPTLTAILGTAQLGTAASGAVSSANVGQMIELVGTNFGPETQVQFLTRDSNGKVTTIAVAPQVINADGTRLQVLVPDLATTGDVRVANVNSRDLGYWSYNDGLYRGLTLSFTADDATTVLSFADGGLEGVDNESWALDNVKVTQGGSTVFADDFESGTADAAWSNSTVTDGIAGITSRFSGRFANQEQRLTLSGLVAGQTYTLTFDLYAFDSWDGASPSAGPDLFQVQADGKTLMRDTITTFGGGVQSLNTSAAVRLQVVPTLSGMSGRPGTESTVTLTGSGFMEGASTITVGGVVTADDYTNISPDVYGSRNDQLAVVLPRTIEGTVRVTTEGGYAEVKVPTNNSALVASFTGIAATAQAGAANLLGTASANAGQTIKLLGLGLTYSTLVEFEGVDDTGKAGIITRQVLTANGAGTEATIAVPALARTGQVRVVGAAGSQTLQVVPTLRSLGGTVAAGNTLIIEGTGLVTSEIVVQVDGRAVGNFAVRTMSDGSDYYYYYYDSQTPEANQQLLTLTLPNGVSNPVVTVSTVGGTATLRLGRAVDSAAVPVAGDPGDTIATASAVALNPGQLRTLSSKIGDTAFGAGDVDLYSVTLAQGDTLSLDLVSGAPANYVRLFDSKGAEVAYQYFTASTASYSFRVKDAGQYFVGVSSGYNYYYDATKANSGSNFGVTGDYTLSLERIGAGQSSLAAIDTKAASGTAAQGGVASANVGQTITLLGSGLRADDQVFFTTIDESGRFSSQSVAPNTVAADGSSLTVMVPMSATTGMVRLGREGAGVLLQIVPTVNDVAMSYVGQAYNGGPINIRGTGFAEGVTSVWFGGRRLADSGRVAGLDVTYDSLPGGSVTNGLIATTVPNGVPAGPISVSTVGGTSAVLPRSFTLLSVVAESGTPADAGQASANVGQSVELSGTGLSLLSGVIFETIDDGGGRGQVVVNPWFANAGGTQIKVTVPPNAATGLLRLVGDQTATAALLQIVPTLRASDVESLSNNGNSARVTLHGSGFVEGNNSEYHFGNTTVFDGSASTGANVYGGAAPDYLANGRVSLDVPVSDAALGGITVRTDGGTSAPLTFGLSAVSGVALSGTPADAGQASANPGQVVTLTGTRLAADTDVLFSYTASDGTSQRVIVNPVSVNAAGTSATILVPEQANGIARLQILGTAAVRTLQIVPTISGLNPSTNGTIQIYGAGFTEGASSVQFLAGAVKDADTSNTTFDVYSATGADNSGIQVVEPGHGLGNVTVTTAGGTSAPKALNEAQTKLGALRGIAIDGSTIWVVDDANPASVHQVSIADGKAVGAALPINSKDFGNSTFFGGLQVVPADFTLGATQVKAGSLLLVNGWAANDRVTAMNPSDGTTIATLTLAKNYDSTASLYDPATGHLFVVDRSVGPNRIVEVDPVTGTEISGFNAPANADEAGLVLDPSGNTIWYASYVSRTIFELSKTGQVLRGFSAAAQGADDSEFTGIAFAADGRLLASTYQGRIYAFDVNRDEAMTRPTITSVTTVAAQGTPAQGGLPSANVGQVIEIVGTNFNAGTQVQFTTRDANGNAGIAVALPNEVNADGTRLQVTVPNLATTGDLRLSNVPVRDLGFSSWADAIYRQVKLSFTADDATTVLRFADGGLEQDVNNESWGLDNIKVADGAITVFSDDFEGAAGAQWSESTISGSADSVFTRFSGRFNNADQRLTLTGLTAGKTYSLTFDLYAFDSWDGGAHGDAFSVSADGVRLMSDTIAGYSPSSSQTFNSSAPVTLQIVPTVASTGGGPGSESAFAIYGSGFAEGGSTVTIGGRSYKDTATDSQPIDVSGARNDTITLGAPTALDGKIRITTAGGYAEIDGPVRARPSPSFFSGIEVPGLLSGVAAGAGAAANVGQNIVLIGQGFSSSTLVQFQAVDDTGTVGTITRGGSVNGDGTRLTITVPALARTGAVTVLGAADTQALQVVPRMRGVGGTIAAGNTILIDGTGFAANEVVVQVDGLAATVQRVTTTADSTTGSYYYAYSGYEEGMQQIMAVTVPAGIGNGVVTVTTSGGTSQVKRYDIAALPDLTPPADVGDTIAGSQTVTIATGQSLNVAAKIGDGSFGNKDVDLYRIDLTAGDLLRLTVSSNAGTYTHLRVFDAAGVEKAERYFSANSTDVVTFRPSAGGTYYVGVSGYSNTTYDPNVANSGNSNFDTGAYNLAIRREQEGATSLTGITTTAAAGTPAQATVPSANPGQSITITGSGLLANDRVVFEVQSGSGYPTTVTVTPTSVAADGASLTVVVPDAAITGMVRLQRESAGLVLQVVPVLLDVGANPNNEFYGYYVTLTGRGFVDGATTLSFGGFQFVDPSRGTGPTVSGTTIAGKYVENGSLQTDMPNGVAAGPISVTTIGGTSNVFDMTFTGISAVAAAGTPADAGLASANPGQTITLTGTHFAMDTDIVFETATDGGKATIVVRPTAVAADGSSADVVVPDAATTGMVRVFGDSLGTEVFLQVVPVVTGADFLNFQGDSTYGQVRLKGRGFVEGNWSTYIFGTSMYDDAGPSYGANVFAGDPDYRGNGTADISISFEDGSFGPIQVRTQGGTSAPFTRTVNGITATAASGTPANPAEASANPGQEITVTGAGLTAQDEFFIGWRESYSGALRNQIVTPKAGSVAADGSSLVLVVPENANGAFRVRLLGASGAPLLQIVPVVTGYDVNGGNLILNGKGFLEGPATYTLGNTVLTDTAGNAGPDVYYDGNDTVQFGEPAHGFGPLTVTTAGGTSAPFQLNEATLPYGYLRDVAFDAATGDIWVTGDSNQPGRLRRIDLATGTEEVFFDMTAASFGSNQLYAGGLQVAPAAFILNGVNVPQGSLLIFNGYASPDLVVAMNPTTGAVIASLSLGLNYDVTAGVYDPATGSLFVLDRRNGPNKVVEIDPTDGTVIASFDLPFNAGEAGLAIDPLGGSLWYGSDQSNSVVELSKTGAVLRTVDLSSQGVNNNEINGLAFDNAGKMIVASRQGRVFKVTLPAAP